MKWTFQDEERLLARIQREYGQALIGMLPTPSSSERLTLNLREGYMTFTVLMLKAMRAYHAARVSALSADQKRSLWRRARSMREAWEVLRRHLVALQLLELQDGPLGNGSEEEAILAERCVEALTDNIELGPVEES